MFKKRGSDKGSSAGGIKTDGRRVSRVEKEVQAIVSTYIIRHLQGELPGLVTIGKVQIPADLRVARVYVSLLNINSIETDQAADVSNNHPAAEAGGLNKTHKAGGKSKKPYNMLDEAIDVLQSHASEIQDEISDKLKMKYLPKLVFFPDESTEKILKIEKILSTINPSDNDVEGGLDAHLDIEDDYFDEDED